MTKSTFKTVWLLDHLELESASLFYMVCNSPLNLRGRYVHQYIDDVYDCVIRQVIIFGGCIMAAFLVTLAVAIPCDKYRWYVNRIRIVWMALKRSLHIVKKGYVCLYDAYVSFDANCQADSSWVVEKLIPAIEGWNEYWNTACTDASSTNTPNKVGKRQLNFST